MLRTAEFKPFVVFISAPSVAKLRELRRHSGQDADKSKPVSVRCVSIAKNVLVSISLVRVAISPLCVSVYIMCLHCSHVVRHDFLVFPFL